MKLPTQAKLAKAVEFEITFAKIRIDDSGFKPRQEWQIAVQTARLSAVKNEHELPWETGSHDATEYLTFEDGSRLMIANPRQATFCGHVTNLKQD